MKKIKEVVKLNKFLNLKINPHLTETDFNDIDVKSHLEHHSKILPRNEGKWMDN